MLMPKKVKYRKQQRGRRRGKAWRGSTLSFGDFGLKVLEPGYITDRQIEASRVAMTRFVKRGGKVFIRLFPGRTTATQPSGAPLPLPIRVSAGFFVTGLSGKRRIQTLPPRLTKRVMATR